MEVRGTAGTPVDWGAMVQSLARALPVPASAAPEDRVEALLEQLAAVDAAGGLGASDRRSGRPPETLLREACEKFERGRPEQAVAALARWARAHPLDAEALLSEPSLEPQRAEVSRLLQRLGAEARSQAEVRLDRTTELVSTLGPRPMSSDFDTPAMLAIAARFVETGRLADCARGGELARAVLERYSTPPIRPAGRPLAAAGRAAAEQARRLWARAPLLVLLLAWLALGLSGAFGRGMWPVGLLALVGLGFYARVRRLRL